MARGGRKPGASLARMASVPTSRSGTPNTGGKQIPLFCNVCPDAPRFSDVSHLLTHIASKGHLHHETQTKLKAHQDISASLALQAYEQWYKDNGIEVLLVERMKAKQVKEAARNKRSRIMASAAPTKQAKRKPAKRSASNTLIKREEQDYSPDFPLFPGFYPPEVEAEVQDEFFIGSDMMSLKGQVWPGMGKMDLANEEMRRTRNQRKPKSVIEKMRRTSEGIEPTQVVMTSEFEVERVKGVYDESDSPAPGQEEESVPRKSTRGKRKKTNVLAEISVNVPRGGNGRRNAKMSKPRLDYDRESTPGLTPSLGPFRNNRDIFQDDEGSSGVFDSRSFATPSQRDQRFDLRDRMTMNSVNHMTHPSLVSPTPTSRDIPGRPFGTRDAGRGRPHGQAYFGQNTHVPLGTYQSDASYAMNEPAFYDASARMPFSNGHYHSTISQESFRFSSGNQLQSKQEEYSNPTGGDPLSNSGASQFLSMPGANPLFSQDQMFLNSYNQTPPNQSLSLGFTPINHEQEDGQPARQDPEQRVSRTGVKLEAQMTQTAEDASNKDVKRPEFNASGIWDSQSIETDLGIHEDLGSEQLEI